MHSYFVSYYIQMARGGGFGFGNCHLKTENPATTVAVMRRINDEVLRLTRKGNSGIEGVTVLNVMIDLCDHALKHEPRRKAAK